MKAHVLSCRIKAPLTRVFPRFASKAGAADATVHFHTSSTRPSDSTTLLSPPTTHDTLPDHFASLRILINDVQPTSQPCTKMSRQIEQALLSLLPTQNSNLPPPLIELAGSLLAQSRLHASTLKAEEDVARLYACCHLACDR